MNNTDTEGTLTPTPSRLNKRQSDSFTEDSSLMLEQGKQLIKALRQSQKESMTSKTLTENNETEFFSAQSDTESSSNWK